MPWWQQDWWNKLWPLLLDKALLGAVAVLLGFVLAKQLERFRRLQAGIGELVKARITATTEVYAGLFSFEEVLHHEELNSFPGMDSRQMPPPPIETGDVLYAAAARSIARHRFLLGPDFYSAATSYLNSLQQCRVALECGNQGIPDGAWAVVNMAFQNLERTTPADVRVPPDEMPKLPKRAVPPLPDKERLSLPK